MLVRKELLEKIGKEELTQEDIELIINKCEEVLKTVSLNVDIVNKVSTEQVFADTFVKHSVSDAIGLSVELVLSDYALLKVGTVGFNVTTEDVSEVELEMFIELLFGTCPTDSVFMQRYNIRQRLIDMWYDFLISEGVFMMMGIKKADSTKHVLVKRHSKYKVETKLEKAIGITDTII